MGILIPWTLSKHVICSLCVCLTLGGASEGGFGETRVSIDVKQNRIEYEFIGTNFGSEKVCTLSLTSYVIVSGPSTKIWAAKAKYFSLICSRDYILACQMRL